MPMIFYDPNAGEVRGKLPAATNPYVIGGVRFMPGTNQVSEQQWNTLLNHPNYGKAIATRLEMGKLRLMKAPKTESEPSLSDYNLADAKEMILSCHDLDLLRRWQGEDTRKGAQTAIAEQIKKLLPPSENSSPDLVQSTDLDTPVFA